MAESFFYPRDPSTPHDWKGYTLVMCDRELFQGEALMANRASSWQSPREWPSALSSIRPAISVGNIGQLAIDVLIFTTNADQVGSIYHDSLLPMVGNNPYTTHHSHCQLSTCCDVYCKSEHKLLILQQRATFIKGKRQLFRAKLLEWMKAIGLSRIVLIGSIFSHIRTDSQISGTQFRYLATDPINSEMSQLKGMVELEETPDAFGRLGKQMPGSGITKTLFHDCENSNIPMVCLLMFCAEGDNAGDALQIVNFANKLLRLQPVKDDLTIPELQSQWKIPPSWSHNFGNKLQQIIY